MNTATARFDTTVRKMTIMSQRKENRLQQSYFEHTPRKINADWMMEL